MPNGGTMTRSSRVPTATRPCFFFFLGPLLDIEFTTITRVDSGIYIYIYCVYIYMTLL